MSTPANVASTLPRTVKEETPAPKKRVAAALSPLSDWSPSPNWQQQFVRPEFHGQYVTKLTPQEEQQFQQWWNSYSAQNPGMENPDKPNVSYDYRGWFKAKQAGDPRAVRKVNLNDNRLHFNDAWKTPYHQSFSRESIYALPSAPDWTNDDRLVDSQGRVYFDEKKKFGKK